MNTLNDLKNDPVFKYFFDICAIPHGSGNTSEISNYCVEFAKSRNLWYMRDALNNVIIKKGASAGYENAEPIILQGHLDMVCEKEEDCVIDFERDALDIYIDNGFIRARGTTLGGDDGIAVAYILALLDSDDIPHPAIEAVLISDEETGMYGAKGLDASVLSSHTVINMDSENEGVFTVSCAGGASVKVTLPVSMTPSCGTSYELTVDGLTGGHSGVEIHKRRANANKIMSRLICELANDITVSDFHGGLKANAIPVSAAAKIIAPADITSDINRIFSGIKAHYKKTDPDMTLTVSAAAFGAAADGKIAALLSELPDGLIKMSDVIKNLAETSLNIGITKIENGVFSAEILVRSSVNSEKAKLIDEIRKIADAFGAETEVYDEYPAWELREASPIRDTFTAAYRTLYGSEPKIEAIHAGLECGILAGKIDNLDCISIGPDVLDIHTPRERLSVDSVIRTWELLKEALRLLS